MPLSPIRELTEFDHNELVGASATGALPMELDLNFPGVQTQHATHSLHTYVAAINPPLASALIEHYVPAGEVILDPFVGGGGVLIEALRSGRRGIGCDVNPLAVLLSKVKTTFIPSARTLRVYQDLVDRAQSLGRNANIEEIPDIVRFWYRDDSLAPLRGLQRAIEEIENTSIRDLFYLALSATSRDVMLTYRGEIRLRKLQGSHLERFKPNVWEVFKKRAVSAIDQVSRLPQQPKTRVELRDSRQLTHNHRCHTVITSPPYGDDKNGVGYFQFSRNMLYWIGVSLEDQRRMRESFLGSDTSSRIAQQSATLDRALEAILAIKESQFREAAAFYSDYQQVLKRLCEVAEQRVIIVIGDRVLARTKISNGHITTELMRELGWELEHYYTRQIRKKRIANLGGDGGGISLEHIMVFQRG